MPHGNKVALWSIHPAVKPNSLQHNLPIQMHRIATTACWKRGGGATSTRSMQGEGGGRGGGRRDRKIMVPSGRRQGDIAQGTSWFHVPRSKPLGHLIQAFLERGGLLQGVRSRCCELRAVFGNPLLILLSLRPIRFACAIGGHIEGLDLVDVVVIHAPLGEDILAPCAKLPIAAVARAWRERGVALLQIFCQHSNCCLADD